MKQSWETRNGPPPLPAFRPRDVDEQIAYSLPWTQLHRDWMRPAIMRMKHRRGPGP